MSANQGEEVIVSNDGSMELRSKSITYWITEDECIGYRYWKDADDSAQEELAGAEEKEINGDTTYSIVKNDGGTEVYASTLIDGDTYTIRHYRKAGVGEGEVLEDILSKVAFVDDLKLDIELDVDVPGISFDINALNLRERRDISQSETEGGDLRFKYISFFNKEEDDVYMTLDLIQFGIRGNKTIEESVGGGEIEEVELNGVNYVAEVEMGKGKPYSYYAQRGDDVYFFHCIDAAFDSGVEEEFAKFMESVSFE